MSQAQELYDYAVAHYPEKKGDRRWDYIVETMTVAEIEEEFFDNGKQSWAQAMKSAKDYCDLLGGRESEVQAEIF